MEKIWIAKYNHRHGEDLSAHRTRKGALTQIAAWAKEWAHEFRRQGTEAEYLAIEALIANHNRHEDLIFAWCEYSQSEDMSIEEVEVNE